MSLTSGGQLSISNITQSACWKTSTSHSYWCSSSLFSYRYKCIGMSTSSSTVCSSSFTNLFIQYIFCFCLLTLNFLFSLVEEQDEEGLPSSVEDEPKTPQDFTPEQNQKDLEQSLDPNTDPSKFDVEGISPEHSVQHIEKILKWSEKLNEFAKFLNSPTEDSLHKILANNDRSGSLLKGVTRKASDSITRITGEIEKLKAVLDTYINTAPKKLRDQDSIKLAG